ncbi:hypothetical protein POSPLADRAFT_1127666 [Postia placenta MAD-698-R-SB12]|uniref:Uncharacterized protein n=1 Tax=Postia placenta MAD-698-R-SB12 TaxID=670580 RepID=A0A1X6NG11_9APHY|nr:hypothetical protein POSPLADRAFT_1127666 [Postia placenta MAD-698-R-SB12]OSX67578.1 hypothetical protein POSPLADRAFT_1127666 [Postia placenta MAD-698-R-SB12]
MAEFLQRLDTSKLVLVGAGLSFAVSAFSAPRYNLPIFLFGIYAQENAEAVQSLQTFTYLLSASIVYDIIWMFRNEQHWLVKLITILALALKASLLLNPDTLHILTYLQVPTVMAFFAAMQQRGGQLSGLSFRGGDLNGATVWSMPGGFTSGGREGYQTVDETTDVQTPKPLGTAAPALNNPPNAPGAYHNV